MENFSYKGWWWIPENEVSRKYPTAGILSFSQEDGLTLELFGNPEVVSEEERSPMRYFLRGSQWPSFPMLYGALESGKYTTLIDCRTIGSKSGNIQDPARRILRLDCSIAYVGHGWLDDPDEPFHTIRFSLTGLLEFVGDPTGFISQTDEETVNPSSINSLAYNPPDPHKAESSEHEISLFQYVEVLESLKDVSNELRMEEKALLRVHRSDPLSLSEWLIQYIEPLSDLVSLAIDGVVSIVKLSIVSEISIRGEDNDSTIIPKLLLDVFLPQVTENARARKRRLDDRLMFSLQESEISFSDIIERWFDIVRNYHLAYQLYFGARTRQGPYLESRFLVLTQVIELLHRAKFSGDGRAEVDQVRIEQIVERVSREDRDWVRSKLSVRPSVHLQLRCQKLLEYLAPIMSQLIGDFSVFSKRVADSRNYYVHYGSRGAKKAATGAELYWLGEVSDMLITAFFISELGYSSSHTIEYFRRNRRFQHIKKNVQRFWNK